MDLLSVIGIGVGLAMDCFAISVASGMTTKTLKIRHVLRMALFFGGFQALMPVVGWLAGKTLAELVSGFDHWVVFAVLSLIGAKMIYESFKIESAEEPAPLESVYVLLVLSVATSIDALAVGFGFAFLRVSIVMPVVVIGLVTFVLSLVGTAVGHNLGHFFEKRIEAVGGLVLIAIGVKILLEHVL